MPWKECSVMDEKLRFIARLIDGEKMASLCREFGISRKTGYKIWDRYKDCGLEGLPSQSRRPYKQANQLPFQIESLIVQIKKDKPNWGARKIRERLRRKHPGIKLPANSTVHAVLDRHGLVNARKRRRYKAEGTKLSYTSEPNALWCADYKGEFLLGNKSYCYPLTITDFSTRYLLTCEALESTKERYAFTVFERTFKEYGLPKAIRTDNGIPFSNVQAMFGLSRLSVWWLRLGIQIERTAPGCPQQNGRHERMHLTLKKEATKPSGQNLLQQQEKFDRFTSEYNHDRPHEALDMKYPGEVYKPSMRPYEGISEVEYPMHDKTVTVTHCGRICVDRRKINFSRVFAGQDVGVRQVDDRIWLVSFMNYDLGYFDEEAARVEPGKNPFEANVLPM
ncbi:MAG: transposase [Bdellovibrionaceae bacterium]|nr:transposase [Pseudobdellovibrionaceae bacterium]MCB9085741.1 transposase [Pseudobdellovibrionaceae bacterium]